MMANQLNTVVVEKLLKKAMMIDGAISDDSSRKKDVCKKYRGLKDLAEKICDCKGRKP